MSQRVRIGVIGTSWWADLMHLPACKSHERADLVAICGRNVECAREMARKYEIPQVFTDYRKMIREGSLNAVVVSVPDDLHYEMSLDAIHEGLHVICEKPLAMSVAQAREMCERAEEKGLKHMTYFTRRWMPGMRYIHRLIENGYVGKLISAEFRYLSGNSRSLGPKYVWRQDGKRSVGVIGDFGAHMIDQSRWLVGEATAVTAHLTCNVARFDDAGRSVAEANDSAMLLIEYSTGSHATIHVSKVSHIGDRGQEESMTLYGEDGTLCSFGNMKDGYRLVGAKRSENTLQELRIPEDMLAGVDLEDPVMKQLHQVFTEHSAGCRAFVDAILEDCEVSPSFVDGLRVQEVIEAALLSNDEKKRVVLE